MLSLHGQMVVQHWPDSLPLDWKYVQFSLEVAPQLMVTRGD